ncbi:acetate--CoA ligase family protein [Pelotomaculum terephthalicicum JT]|nr:acetate--CoA ligase family protein [Pelotomaculum terephthalicicum]MCG9969506.1 acetate--CoA ligase family protein [Pelotomaculum terephthalicicum JT]
MPEICELDFNPVLAYPDQCLVVDARVILSSELAPVSTA